MTEKASINHLSSEGYVIIPSFLSGADCQYYSERLEILIDEDIRGPQSNSQDTYMVHNPMLRDQSFMRFLKRSIMTEIVASALHETFLLYAFTTSTMPSKGTNWSRRVHVDCPRLIPGYTTNINAFIPLTDISAENGGIELLPRSHWQKIAPTEQQFESAKLVPELRAGSLLVFHSRLWHSGGHNNSARPRHALTFNFCRSFMRQRFDYPRMTPESRLQYLDEMQKQLLGFNVRVPASLAEYHLPESDRLYKPDQG